MELKWNWTVRRGDGWEALVEWFPRTSRRYPGHLSAYWINNTAKVVYPARYKKPKIKAIAKVKVQ